MGWSHLLTDKKNNNKLCRVLESKLYLNSLKLSEMLKIEIDEFRKHDKFGK